MSNLATKKGSLNSVEDLISKITKTSRTQSLNCIKRRLKEIWIENALKLRLEFDKIGAENRATELDSNKQEDSYDEFWENVSVTKHAVEDVIYRLDVDADSECLINVVTSTKEALDSQINNLKYLQAHYKNEFTNLTMGSGQSNILESYDNDDKLSDDEAELMNFTESRRLACLHNILKKYTEDLGELEKDFTTRYLSTNTDKDVTPVQVAFWNNERELMLQNLCFGLHFAKDRRLVSEYIQSQFNNIPAEFITRKVHFYLNQYLYNEKRRAAERDFRRKRRQLLTHFEAQINEYEAMQRKNLQFVKEKMEVDLKRLNIQIVHESKFTLVHEERSKKRYNEEDRKRKEDLAERLKEKQHQEAMRHNKQSLATYKKTKLNLAAEEAVRQQEVDKKQAQDAKVISKLNAIRLQRRREITKLKDQTAQSRRDMIEKIEEERQDRLLKAIKRLAPNVERNPTRLLQPTEAFQSFKLSANDIQPSVGFTVDELMSDARYKLASALFNAGMSNTLTGTEYLSKVSEPFVGSKEFRSQLQSIFK